jgi:hypothetical protein
MLKNAQNPFRFAGDVFSGGGQRTSEDESQLIEYFPALKDFNKRIGEKSETGAKTTGGYESVDPFAGYKKFESQGEFTQVPKFGGFKKFERA